MITNKITDKITDMTSKLQMLITFATVVRLRPTIYQNAQNSEENLDKGICSTIFFKKKTPLNASISCSKIKHPTFFSFLFLFSSLSLFFFSNFCNFFFLKLEIKLKQIFFDTKSKRHKKQEQEQKRDKNKNKNKTKTQT